jgi:hypothetical protein
MTFEEIFGPGKQARPASISPEARKWRQFFADNVAAVLRVRNIPRSEAEKVAFANTVTAYLDAGHPNTDPNFCAHCGKREELGAVLKPIGWGARHTWLHDGCWEAWRTARRSAAIEKMASMGIVRP